MIHHKTSLPCAYLGLCSCLFPIQWNDCKTPNGSRKTQGWRNVIAKCSCLLPKLPTAALGVELHPEPSRGLIPHSQLLWAQLDSSHGQDNDHRHEHGNVLVFFCVLSTRVPTSIFWQFREGSDYCFGLREAREGRAVQPSKAVWEKSDQDQTLPLWLKEAFLLPPKTTQSLKKHFHHPVGERLCCCCETRTVASHPSMVLGREMNF